MARYSIEYGTPSMSDQLDPPLRPIPQLAEDIAKILGKLPNYLFGKTRKQIQEDIKAQLELQLGK